MADPRLKQITIKTGVLKRLAKEVTVYQKEADVQKTKVEKLREADPQDEYMLKKQEEVLQECLMMIPDCQRRVKKAYEELKELLDNEKELNETKQYTSAIEVLETVKETI
ncbi:tubulin-specific chaperone A [Condylostylus longicornis]|uniref:tubulin-specific chaperone A n=1 Tax=Condylostylus longicornis TaxID=2530218 RepID=UPI00244DAEE2|nr:tubulin-specific chaperone A [Condylostylus longicornis]XP_055379477.1 tubulin-specific chaperone A [Condylostylus longicornis]XP_055379478.1 tubulin-specific chaperone A [Condylostylus longicornis]